VAADVQEVEDEDEPTAQINIVPFVDVVLVLLIIFLLTSRIIAHASFPVDLPRAANAGESLESTLNVVVTPAGEVVLDGAVVDRTELSTRIQAQVQRQPKVRAVIAADRGLRYEQVVDVIDVVKGAGVTAFALNFQRAAAPAQ